MTSRTKTRSGFLRHAADRRTLALLLASSALSITHWISGASAHWLVIPGAVLAISACVVKHNHIHAPIFRHPLLNRGLNVWLALLTGTSTTGIRLAHNQRHHRTSQSPEDFVRCSLVRRRSALGARRAHRFLSTGRRAVVAFCETGWRALVATFRAAASSQAAGASCRLAPRGRGAGA